MDNKRLVLEGEISVPYKWTLGEAMGRFFTELRDNRRIIGLRCPRCKKVLIPTQEYCPQCYVKSSDWVELKDTGILQAFTVVEYQPFWRPMDPPYAIGAIRLEGADTDLIHLVVTQNYRLLRPGIKVKAVWKEKREGSILDIQYFEPLEV